MRELVSLNGRLLPAEDACISVFDSGLMQGVGLFETMRAYRGRVFRQARHIDRLIASARKLGWVNLPNHDELNHNIEQVLGTIADEDASVRLTVTTGSLRTTAGGDVPELTVVATASAGVKYPPEYYRRGVTVLASDYKQGAADPAAGHKTTSYFSRLASLREAYASGAFETLWFSYEGQLAEGAISNVFLVHGEQLSTPPCDTPVLPGVTREAVFELAVDLAIPVREKALTMADLLSADEVFLTNSLMEIMPVVRVGREPVGIEKPGETTVQLYEAYGDLIERECGDG